MDLAEIRKKANRDRDEGTQVPEIEIRPSISIQGVPDEKVSSREMDSESESPVFVSENGAEGLDWLFNSPELSGKGEYEQDDTGEAVEDPNLLKLLSFSLDDEEYALDIENIREIIKPREITDIPRAPGFILGIISLRGIIIPVFDLKQRLKLGTSEIDSISRIIICQIEEHIVGLLVDRISQVVQIPEQKIEPPPAVLSGLDRDLVEGVGRYQGRMVILLNLPIVMDAELI